METVTIPKAEYQQFLELKSRCTELEQQVQFFMEQIRLARQQRFGTSSEKTLRSRSTSSTRQNFWRTIV